MALYIAIRGMKLWQRSERSRPRTTSRRQGRLYGLEIIRYLEDRSRLVLSEGTIYPILNRLKAEGLLASEWVESVAGHPRKYYSLTVAGRRRLRLMAEAWTSFSSGLSRLLEPVLEKQEKLQ